MGIKAMSYLGNYRGARHLNCPKRRRALAYLCVSLLFCSSACSGDNDRSVPVASGEIRIVNYNIWGLPGFITNSEPRVRIPQISPLLNDFDIALVQEDFSYHDLLIIDAEHPYLSESNNSGVLPEQIGDGLNRLSRLPFTDFERVPWPRCNGMFDCGSDCLANKGYTFARHQLAEGVEIDIYNLHNEAGRCAEDFIVRGESTDAMFTDMEVRSAGRAVIVVGDFNLLRGDEPDELLLERWDEEFIDVCAALGCEEELERGRRERTYLRDGISVHLAPIEHMLDDSSFYDIEGHKLSNHPPQWARIGWRLLNES